MNYISNGKHFRYLNLLLGFTAALALLMVPQVSLSQETADGSIEEIVVTAERSRKLVWEQLVAAEDAVYESFNEIYAGTDYEMICTMEKPFKDASNPIANAWTERVCRSKLAHEYHQQLMEDYSEYVYNESEGYYSVPVDTQTYNFNTERHGTDLNEKATELLASDPALLAQFQTYLELQAEYDAVVQEEFEEGNFFTNLFRRGE